MFSLGRKVKAEFVIEDEKITFHDDDFDFRKWSVMALGLPERLLGGTSFLRERVKDQALSNLIKFKAQQKRGPNYGVNSLFLEKDLRDRGLCWVSLDILSIDS